MPYAQYTNAELYDLPEGTVVYLHMPNTHIASYNNDCVAAFRIDGCYLISIDLDNELILPFECTRLNMTGIFGIFQHEADVAAAHQAYLA